VKKICINGKFFSQRTTGTQRYARELLREFDRILAQEGREDIAIEILVPRDAILIPDYVNLKVRVVGKMTGMIWEQLELPRFCNGQLLVTLSGGAPLLHPRNVITIHDTSVFAAPDGYSLAFRTWYRALYKWMARKADLVLTVSNFSKLEIVKWCGANPAKIEVTYLGSEHLSELEAEPDALAKFGISQPYILAVSSQNPNKNFARIAQALVLYGSGKEQFVIAGGQSGIYQKDFKLPREVRTLGHVSDVELKALYMGASCFVFASLYEGFGLPPLEAMACGCPVVVSRVASLLEIFAGVAVFCDPYDPNDIAAAVKQLLQSPPATADELQTFAKTFSWHLCACKTLELLVAL
jgi:glycosyltransferase involved in cell wall biosynthesis